MKCLLTNTLYKNRVMRYIYYGFMVGILTAISFQSLLADDAKSKLKQLGRYEYTYFGLSVYDATLFMQEKCTYPQCDLVLQLDYNRDLDGDDIAERSIEEIDSQYNLDKNTKKSYNKILNDIFPNVTENDSIKGKMINGYAEFYLNNHFIGKINDTVLSRRFFDIWLSEKTTDPQMRQELFGNFLKK